MNLPELYAAVDRSTALRGLFPSARPLGTDPADEPQWWGTDDALVCFATVGRWHRGKVRHSYFSSARRFNWVPAVVTQGASVGEHPCIPKEIRARETGGRRLYVFARGQGDPFTFLGESDAAYSWGSDGRSAHATLKLQRTVPSAVLESLGILDRPIEYPRPVDEALHSLAALSLGERLTTLKRFVEYWHGELRHADGNPEHEFLDIELPEPLRWWYRVGGRRGEVFCAQNHLLGFEDPYRVTREAEKLVFYRECQCVWEMATLAVGEDPPTWSRTNEAGAEWVRESIPLSIALVQASILEASMQSMYFASSGSATREIVELIERHVPPVLDGDWHVPTFPTRFLVGGGAVGFVAASGSFDDEDGFSVWLGSKSEHPLLFLRDTDPDVWDDFEI